MAGVNTSVRAAIVQAHPEHAQLSAAAQAAHAAAEQARKDLSDARAERDQRLAPFGSAAWTPDPAGRLADLESDIASIRQQLTDTQARITTLTAEPALSNQLADRLARERDTWHTQQATEERHAGRPPGRRRKRHGAKLRRHGLLRPTPRPHPRPRTWPGPLTTADHPAAPSTGPSPRASASRVIAAQARQKDWRRSEGSAEKNWPNPKNVCPAMTIPTPEEVGLAVEVAAPWFQPFIAACAFAGLRLGEAAGLQIGDVDFLRRTLSVRHQLQGETSTTMELVPPKFGSEWVVYVPDELVTLFSEHVRRTGGPGGWMFSRDGVSLNRNPAGHQWRQVREDAGLDGCTLHDLRHFYASGLIASGCDVVTVQRALGHSSATITLGVYSHLWPTAEDRTRAAAGHLMAISCGLRAD